MHGAGVNSRGLLAPPSIYNQLFSAFRTKTRMVANNFLVYRASVCICDLAFHLFLFGKRKVHVALGAFAGFDTDYVRMHGTSVLHLYNGGFCLWGVGFLSVGGEGCSKGNQYNEKRFHNNDFICLEELSVDVQVDIKIAIRPLGKRPYREGYKIKS